MSVRVHPRCVAIVRVTMVWSSTKGAVVRYALQARRTSGPLNELTRNDTETSSSDDLVFLKAEAKALANKGYTVWIFRQGSSSLPGADGRRLVEELRPTPLAVFTSK